MILRALSGSLKVFWSFYNLLSRSLPSLHLFVGHLLLVHFVLTHAVIYCGLLIYFISFHFKSFQDNRDRNRHQLIEATIGFILPKAARD